VDARASTESEVEALVHNEDDAMPSPSADGMERFSDAETNYENNGAARADHGEGSVDNGDVQN
jgi:hypothetical protein